MKNMIPGVVAVVLLIVALLLTLTTRPRSDERVPEAARPDADRQHSDNRPSTRQNDSTPTDAIVKSIPRHESPGKDDLKKPLVARKSEEPPKPKFWAMKGLVWLAAHQNEDGSFGEGPIVIEGYTLDKTGITALALLPYLGAGYYHGSKDEIGGKFTGDIVNKGLQWLMKHQNADGSIVPDDEKDALINNALAGLALNEAYEMSGSDLFKDSSKAITGYLISHQHRDANTAVGGWGRESSSVDGDTLATALAVEALFSAKLGGMKSNAVVESALDDAAKYVELAMKSSSDPRLAFSWIILTRDRDDSSIEHAMTIIAQKEAAFEQVPLSLYLSTVGAFQFDGPSGDVWTRWGRERVKNPLVRSQSKEGSWGNEGNPDHQIVHTSLATLMLEVYYRYASVPGGGTPLPDEPSR